MKKRLSVIHRTDKENEGKNKLFGFILGELKLRQDKRYDCHLTAVRK